MRYLRLPIAVFLLVLFSAPALGIVNYDSYWYWMWGTEEGLPNSPQLGYEYLTSNNGDFGDTILNSIGVATS